MKVNLSIILWLAWSPFSFALNYQIADAQPKQVSFAIERTGKLAFQHTVNLAFKSTGYLVKLTVNAGDVFQQEQVLASLDAAELIEDKNIKYVQLLQAKRDVKRLTALLKRELSAQQQLDDAKTRLDISRSAYRVAYYNLQKAQINAPFYGVVLSKDAQLNELQIPGRTVLTVAPLEHNWIVKVALTEAELSQIQLQQMVQVHFNTFDMSGIVSKIPALADVHSQLFTIEITLPHFQYHSGIAAGQVAKVMFKPHYTQLLYQLPVSALVGVNSSGQAIIFTQSAQSKIPVRRMFELVRLDGSNVYLKTQSQDELLHYVVQGWQHLVSEGY